MLKQACLICKIFGAFVIIGALNWGAIGIAHVNFVERIFGMDSTVTRALYILVGISGLAILVSYAAVCPACKKA